MGEGLQSNAVEVVETVVEHSWIIKAEAIVLVIAMLLAAVIILRLYLGRDVDPRDRDGTMSFLIVVGIVGVLFHQSGHKLSVDTVAGILGGLIMVVKDVVTSLFDLKKQKNEESTQNG